MKVKKSTPKKSPAKAIEFSWKLIGDLCVKAETNELLRKALKKLTNMNQKNLLAFLGEVQVLFGRLKKIIPDIILKATENFNTKNFFKTRENGGIFFYVDPDIIGWFDTEIKNSPAKELAGYEFTEDITEESIVGDAKAGEIYEEVDLAHVAQLCERHYKSESIFMMDKATLFWVRKKAEPGKVGELCLVHVWLAADGLYVGVFKFDAPCQWDAGYRSFFRN
jgi:hypothetical protein